MEFSRLCLATRSSQQADVEALRRFRKAYLGFRWRLKNRGRFLVQQKCKRCWPREALEDARPLLQQVRALDLRLGDLVAQVAKAQEDNNRILQG